MTLDELKLKREELDLEIKNLEEKQRHKQREIVYKKILNMSDEEKQILLSLVSHSRSSCDEDSDCPINGFSEYSNKFDCPKCMLIEILNGEHGGRFDFSFSVHIQEV